MSLQHPSGEDSTCGTGEGDRDGRNTEKNSNFPPACGSGPAGREFEEESEVVVALDVGSARVACAIAELGAGQPLILAAESAASYGIRGGEIVDIKRASEAIHIALQSAAEKAEAEVKTVVVGLSGDVKLSAAKAAMELDAERRTVLPADVARLRKCVAPEVGAGRRVVHRFDGPFSVGDLNGVDHPEGLVGGRLEMRAAFLSAAGDRLDNLLKAVRAAEVEIEAVALEPMACSLGALSLDERALGAAVLDLGAGAFRGALWEGGRLRQIHVAGQESSASVKNNSSHLANASLGINGMDDVVLAVARRFRIAPATAARLLHSHAALGENEVAALPPTLEVAAVDGLGSVTIDIRELSRTVEELLMPLVRSLREGLSGFSPGHAVGVVLAGGGARLNGMAAWISKRFGNAAVRVGAPRWRPAERVQVPSELAGPCGCSLAGLIELAAEERAKTRQRNVRTLLGKFGDRLKRFVAAV